MFRFLFHTILVIIPAITRCQHVLIKEYFSPAVDLTLKYTIILPDSYKTFTQKKYPVFYLLHGHTGNYTSWISYAQLPTELVNHHECIIILPDGGNSWYVNWSGQTDRKPHRWEDAIVNDLRTDVESNFRTIQSSKGRAIGGLSMGGFGAISIGIRHSDLFGFVSSSSGAINYCVNIKKELERDTVDWNSPQLWSDGTKTIDIEKFSTQSERTPKGLVFLTAKQADEYEPYSLLSKKDSGTLPYLHIDCGTKDDFLPDAIMFVEALKKRTVNYSCFISPGEHENPYWQVAIRRTFSIWADWRKS